MKFFCSWSGGKDSCLALYKAIKAGGVPKFLYTMCIESGERTRSHGLAVEIIRAQAKSLKIDVILQNSSWSEYQGKFIEKLKQRAMIIDTGVFGDIDFEENRKWEQGICNEIKIKPFLPLWGQNRQEILSDFLEYGFKAKIVAIKDSVMSQDYLAKELNLDMIRELEKNNIDICGENGEYHTVVVDGPIFSNPIVLEPKDVVFRSGYWFQDYCVVNS